VTGDAVAAASHGQLVSTIARHRDDALHIRDIRYANDRRWSLVDAAIENGTRLVVGRIVGRNDAAVDVGERARPWREVSR
jgi:hypothetical protein